MATQLSFSYKPMEYVNRDLNVLQNSLKTIDARHQAAVQKMADLEVALGQLDIDSSEEPWRAGYAQKIRDTIDSTARYGDYSKSLTTAIKMAGQAASSPEVLGRVKANAEHKDFINKLNARNDISELTKQRFAEQNPYHYEDTYDENGNIIGGTKWQANGNPVAHVDSTKIFDAALRYVAKESGGGQSVAYFDANGNKLNGYSADAIMKRHNGTTWEALPKEKIDAAVRMVINSDPNIKASIQQDYDDLAWQFGKSVDNLDFDAIYNNQLSDGSGGLKSLNEYINDTYGSLGQIASYRHVHNTMNESEANGGYDGLLKRQAAAQAIAESTGGMDTVVTQGLTIQADGQSYMNDALNKKNSSFNEILNWYNKIANAPKISKAKLDYYATHPDEFKTVCLDAIDGMRINAADTQIEINKVKSMFGNYDAYNNSYNNMVNKAGADKDALEFVNAVNSGYGIDRLAKDNNKYAQSYINKKNNLFTANGQYISVNVDAEQYMKFINEIGIPQSDFAKNGISITNKNGKYDITVNRNSDNVFQFFNDNNIVGNYNILDNNKNVIKSIHYDYEYPDSAEGVNNFTKVNPLNGLNISIPRDKVNEHFKNNSPYINPTSTITLRRTPEEEKAEFEGTVKSLMANTQQWLAGSTLYIAEDGTMDGKAITNHKDKMDYVNRIKNAFNGISGEKVTFAEGYNAITGKTGIQAYIVDKDGKKGFTVYCDDVYRDQRTSNFDRDAVNVANHKVVESSLSGVPIVVGDAGYGTMGILSPVDNTGMFDYNNGKQTVRVSRDVAQKIIEIQRYVDDCADEISMNKMNANAILAGSWKAISSHNINYPGMTQQEFMQWFVDSVRGKVLNKE